MWIILHILIILIIDILSLLQRKRCSRLIESSALFHLLHPLVFFLFNSRSADTQYVIDFSTIDYSLNALHHGYLCNWRRERESEKRSASAQEEEGAKGRVCEKSRLIRVRAEVSRDGRGRKRARGRNEEASVARMQKWRSSVALRQSWKIWSFNNIRIFTKIEF